jgi:hypothetical protein
MRLLQLTANIVPHAEAEFVGLAVAAFGAEAVLTKKLATLDAA